MNNLPANRERSSFVELGNAGKWAENEISARRNVNRIYLALDKLSGPCFAGEPGEYSIQFITTALFPLTGRALSNIAYVLHGVNGLEHFFLSALAPTSLKSFGVSHLGA